MNRMGRPRSKETLAEKMANKTDRRGALECWPWIGACDPSGYGQFWNHKARRTVQSHRIAYRLAHGKMPKRHVLHSCDNPKCVNPSHLFLGTDADNKADAVKKGRHVHGERHFSAKLRECDVREIRSSAGSSLRELASRYGVSAWTIAKVIQGSTWRHVR